MTDSRIQKEHWRIFKKIPRYAVSDLGRVKLIAEREGAADRILTPYLASSHGIAVRLRKPGSKVWKPMVRRLVALVWLPGPERKHVHHLNGDYTDCRACNLAWSDSPPWWFGRPGKGVRAVSRQTGRTAGVYPTLSDGARAHGIPRASIVADAVRSGGAAGGVLWSSGDSGMEEGGSSGRGDG